MPAPYVPAPLAEWVQSGFREITLADDTPGLFTGDGAAAVARALSELLA
jgi:hypothetical protein